MANTLTQSFGHPFWAHAAGRRKPVWLAAGELKKLWPAPNVTEWLQITEKRHVWKLTFIFSLVFIDWNFANNYFFQCKKIVSKFDDEFWIISLCISPLNNLIVDVYRKKGFVAMQNLGSKRPWKTLNEPREENFFESILACLSLPSNE